MTEAELERLISDCPTLYHMANESSWQRISQIGLLSTTAILDYLGMDQMQQRTEYEARRRPHSMTLQLPNQPTFTLRDNKPIKEHLLARSLEDGLTTEDWFRILNRRVFFWLSRERLRAMQSAYPNQNHDVLEVETRSLVEAYQHKITLSAINSGTTFANPQPRGLSTFRSIGDYPYGELRRPRKKRVAELAVDYSVPDIEKYVVRVVTMRNGDQTGILYDKPSRPS